MSEGIQLKFGFMSAKDRTLFLTSIRKGHSTVQSAHTKEIHASPLNLESSFYKYLL